MKDPQRASEIMGAVAMTDRGGPLARVGGSTA